MTYVIAYVAVLIVFGMIDAVWLTTMGAVLYRPALGDILAPNLRVVPAIAFSACRGFSAMASIP
jgi:uncharacterized membrane protein